MIIKNKNRFSLFFVVMIAVQQNSKANFCSNLLRSIYLHSKISFDMQKINRQETLREKTVCLILARDPLVQQVGKLVSRNVYATKNAGFIFGLKPRLYTLFHGEYKQKEELAFINKNHEKVQNIYQDICSEVFTPEYFKEKHNELKKIRSLNKQIPIPFLQKRHLDE